MEIFDTVADSLYSSLSQSMPSNMLMPFLMLAFVLVVIFIVKDIITYLRRRGNPFLLLMVLAGLGYLFYLYFQSH